MALVDCRSRLSLTSSIDDQPLRGLGLRHQLPQRPVVGDDLFHETLGLSLVPVPSFWTSLGAVGGVDIKKQKQVWLWEVFVGD